MAKCPFKKIEITTIEYSCSDYANARGKPREIIKTIGFGECEYSSCKAYDRGICLMMKGNK